MLKRGCSATNDPALRKEQRKPGSYLGGAPKMALACLSPNTHTMTGVQTTSSSGGRVTNSRRAEDRLREDSLPRVMPKWDLKEE